MVTFTTDYWAPALDSRSRRRTTELEEKAARTTRERIPFKNASKNKEIPVVDITDPTKSPFNNDLNKSKSIDNNNNGDDSKFASLKVETSIAAPTTSSVSSYNATSSIDRNSSIDSTSITSTLINSSKSNNDPHKRKSLVQSVQKLFHHESKEQLQQNKQVALSASPVEEKSEFTFGGKSP